MWLWVMGLALASDEAPEAANEHGLVGLRVVGAGALEEGEAQGWVGTGAALETPLIEDLLEIEVVASSLRSAEGHEVPVELVVEHVFHLGRVVDPFIGAGPMLVVSDAAEGPTLGAGGVVATGLHLWFGEHVGALLEADAVVVHRAVWTEALEGVGGLLVRF